MRKELNIFFRGLANQYVLEQKCFKWRLYSWLVRLTDEHIRKERGDFDGRRCEDI